MGSQDLGGMSMLGAPTHIPGETVAQDLWEGGWGGRRGLQAERVWAFPPLWRSVG